MFFQSNKLQLFLYGIIFLKGLYSTRILKFTNVKCVDLPTSGGLTKFDYCRLKVVKRNQVELSLKCTLSELPVTNISMKMQLYQRRDGYRPFLYNLQFDFCKLMNASKNTISFEKYIFDMIRKDSNFNHSCPWNENYMMVEKFAFDFQKADMPVPTGVYRLDFTVFLYGIPCALAQVYFEKS